MLLQHPPATNSDALSTIVPANTGLRPKVIRKTITPANIAYATRKYASCPNILNILHRLCRQSSIQYGPTLCSKPILLHLGSADDSYGEYCLVKDEFAVRAWPANRKLPNWGIQHGIFQHLFYRRIYVLSIDSFTCSRLLRAHTHLLCRGLAACHSQ